MKKKYLVEFTHLSGEVEKVELVTDDIQWSIDQWSRHRAIKDYKIISEGSSTSKKMLFG